MVHPKGVKETPLLQLCNSSATALPQLYYRLYIVAHTIVCTNGSTLDLPNNNIKDPILLNILLGLKDLLKVFLGR